MPSLFSSSINASYGVESPAWTRPLFPNLQTLKFRGCRWITASETYASISCLLPLMSGTSIKFFEISYGLLPYCCGVHGEKSPDANMDTTWFREGRKETDQAVCQIANSLRVYIDSDTLGSGAYSYHTNILSYDCFNKLQLVIYTVRKSVGWNGAGVTVVKFGHFRAGLNIIPRGCPSAGFLLHVMLFSYELSRLSRVLGTLTACFFGIQGLLTWLGGDRNFDIS